MKYLIPFFALFIIAGLNAQQLDKSVFPIAGIVPGQNVITATAGEIVGGSFENNTFYLGNGFQNSTERETTALFIEQLGREILLYPNPTRDHFFVSFSRGRGLDNFAYQILNPWGQHLQSGRLDGTSKNRINTHLLRAGQYYLVVSQDGKSAVLPFIITQ